MAELDREYGRSDTEIAETASGKVYEFELEKDKNKTEVMMDPDGKILKTESAAEEEDIDW